MAVPSVAYAAYRRSAPRASISIPVDQWQQQLSNSLGNMGRKPVAINIGGKRFETYEHTLNRFPNTLLGCPDKRQRHYDEKKEEYFFDRHRSSFTAILYYYQSGGVLERPPHIPAHIFMEEIEFFQLSDVIQQQNKAIKEEAERNGDGVPGVEQTIIKAEKTDPDEPQNELQKKIWKLFEQPSSSRGAKTLAIASLVVIVLSIIVFCVETLPALNDDPPKRAINGTRGEQPKGTNAQVFFVLNAICSGWFTVEYVIRLVVSTNKLKFLKSFLNILDLLSILPFYMNLLLQSHAGSIGVLRVMRVIRVCRIFKLTRHSKGLYILGMTLKASMNELFMLMLFLLIGVILFASAVYYAEVEENTKQFASIPHAFWWAVVTMTTVGYGDVSPITLVGKLVGAMCALSGVLAIALPVPVIVSNFEYYYKEVLEKEEIVDTDHCNNISYKNLNQLVKSPMLERKLALSRNVSPVGTPTGTPRFARHTVPAHGFYTPDMKKKNGALKFPKDQIQELENCSSDGSKPTSPEHSTNKLLGVGETFI